MNFILTILFSVFTIYSAGQIKVENIKTEKDVLKFLDTHYFKWNKGDTIITFKREIDTSKIYYLDSFVTKFIDSANYPNWIKKDFNGDKKLDLLVSYFYGYDSKVMAFLSQKNNTYKSAHISNQSDEKATYFIYPLNEESSQIVIGNVNEGERQWDTSYLFSDRFKRDTIEYRSSFSGFIDSKYLLEAEFNIDTIKFKLWSYKRYFNDDLVICKNGYIKRTQVKPVGDSKGAKIVSEKYISSDSIKELFDFANKIPFNKFDSAFLPTLKNWFDGMGIYTVFSNKAGFKIGFSDFLMTGPLTFQRFYDLIMKVRKYKNWKIVETIPID